LRFRESGVIIPIPALTKFWNDPGKHHAGPIFRQSIFLLKRRVILVTATYYCF
jgi:hypothetical protein